MTDYEEEAIAEGRPFAERRGASQIGDDFLLTHVIWHPTSLAGYGDCPETGVRFLKQLDERGRPRFSLIQHGWRDFKKAEHVIVSGLKKGWDTDRISAIMERIKRR